MRTFVFAFLLFFCVGVVAQQKPQDKFQSPKTFRKKICQTAKLDYLLFLPEKYKEQKKWPLILFLHGAGERGSDIWRADIHGPSKYLVDHPDFPFILVTPLCPTNQAWQNYQLVALLDEIEQKYKVDVKRIYLTGLSMGGYGTWTLAFAHPERFAAIAPICGGASSLDLRLAIRGYAPQKLSALRGLGIWAFHGGKDTVVTPDESERLIELLKEARVEDLNYTLYPEATHNSWSETYANPQLYEWFLKHERN